MVMANEQAVGACNNIELLPANQASPVAGRGFLASHHSPAPSPTVHAPHPMLTEPSPTSTFSSSRLGAVA